VTSSTVLRAPRAVTSRVPFVVTVDVEPVSPGRRVVVSVEQTRGDEPKSLLASTEISHAVGQTVYASFQITLRERGPVLLVATAHDDGGAEFPPDSAVIDVL
jgi:hypothetical protein